MMKKVVIIGGGVIGQFSAYYLSKNGHEVTIVDDRSEMTPASEGNCGLVTPSHVLPLNSGGAIFQGIKWMFKKDAPLSIKPQLDASFISWMLNFIKYSSSGSIKKAMAARHKLLQHSFELYKAFFLEEPNNSEWQTSGFLYVCKEEKTLAHISREIELQKTLDLKCRILSAEETFEQEPFLNKNIVGGALMESDAWLNPTNLLKDLRRINEVNGVSYRTGKIDTITLKNQHIACVRDKETDYHADSFVLSAGAASSLLLKKVGIRLPVIPGKGYNLTSREGQSLSLKRPLYMLEKKVVATPWNDRFRLGSTMEFSGYDMSLNKERLHALKAAASMYLTIDPEEYDYIPWAGWRPMKDDGIPIIDGSDKIKNLVVATGHSMTGLSMAPATGVLVNEIVSR